MSKKPSSIPANILACIPAEEKGCSVYENKARGVYYVFRRISTKYDAQKGRGVDTRESVGVIRGNQFFYSKAYLAKRNIERLSGKPFNPTPEEISGKEKLNQLIESVQDPRMQGKVKYPLEIILLVSVLSALSGGNSAVSIALYWRQHHAQLKDLIEDFPEKDISHDTINRVFQIINRNQFEGLVEKLATPLIRKIARRLLHTDGQSIRASRNAVKKAERSFLNVYDSTNGLIISHKEIGEKENEIPVSQEIFNSLNIENAVVTADALNTQKKFAEILIDRNADYCLAVKENHKKLYNTIRALFNNPDNLRKESKSVDCSHGRIEERIIEVMNPKFLGPHLLKQWSGLEAGAIIAATTQSEEKRNDAREKKSKSCETRYFISSLAFDAENAPTEFAEIIRRHWSIENNVHWTLDNCFNQDKIQAKNENYLSARVTLNKIAFNLLTKKKEELMKSGTQRFSMDSLKKLCQSPADALETVYNVLGSSQA
jgi:predicted transposase YbfD/YdcC